jgi:hypothetical protein
MKAGRPARSLAFDFIAAAGVLTIAGYLAHAAGQAILAPGLGSRFLAPQEAGCVIRQDVCRLVGWLRENKVATFDTGPELTVEAVHRLVELGYPIRAARGAPVRIELCRAGSGEPRLRVIDVKRSGERDADFCIFDRR